jgi:hypothetical protein
MTTNPVISKELIPLSLERLRNLFYLPDSVKKWFPPHPSINRAGKETAGRLDRL